MSLTVKRPRGTADMLPSDAYKWHYLEDQIRATAREFGFLETRFPTFEHTELFLRAVGDTTDVVQKEMYTFTDKGDRSITLRPEGTASVVRSYLENSMYAGGLPVKVYYLAPNFRYEKPQAGRLREHHQFGVEYFGSYGASADAEVIMLLHRLLGRLGIRDIELRINSIGCPACRPGYQSALRQYFESKEDRLCGTCHDRLKLNPMRILDCKNASCGEIAGGAPRTIDHLCPECEEHMRKLTGYLDAVGISFSIDSGIVRGLDYYTRTVFEFVTTTIGAQGTVCGGGRYDSLIEELGGQPTGGLGFGCGLERLLMVMETQGIEIERPPQCDVFVAGLGDDVDIPVQKLVHELRLLGLAAERDTLGRSLKVQMKYADKIGARYCVVIGDAEIQIGSAVVKNMTARTESEPIPLDAPSIAAEIK